MVMAADLVDNNCSSSLSSFYLPQRDLQQEHVAI